MKKNVSDMTKQEVLDELNAMSYEEIKYTQAIHKIYKNKDYDTDTKIRKIKAVKKNY